MLEIDQQLIHLGADYAFWPHSHGSSVLYELEKGIQVTQRCVDRLLETKKLLNAECAKNRHLLFEVLPQHEQTPNVPRLNTQWPEASDVFRGMKLGRSLGRGAFGEVFESLSKNTSGQLVLAVKEFPKDEKVPWNYHMLKAIDREIHILRQLQGHPNLCQIKGVMHAKKGIYMAMEMAGDRSLQLELETARDHRLPWSIAREIHVQIVSALQHCHGLGVAHHDLKPENLMIKGLREAIVSRGSAVPTPGSSSMLKVKLVDFGLAKMESQSRHDESGVHAAVARGVCGTFPFIPPEAIRQVKFGVAHYDGKKGDIWALGVTLLDMLCGSGLFEKRVLAACPMQVSPDQDLSSWSIETAHLAADGLEAAAMPERLEEMLRTAESSPPSPSWLGTTGASEISYGGQESLGTWVRTALRQCLRIRTADRLPVDRMQPVPTGFELT